MGNSVRWSTQQIDEYVKRRLARHAEAAAVYDALKPSAPDSEAAIYRAYHPQAKRTLASTRAYPLVTLCEEHGLPVPYPEYSFASPARKWRADYCWPHERLILEVDGGLWVDGRHSRGAGRIADMEKLSEAAIMGYRVIYCTPTELHNGAVLDRVRRALA